MSPILPWWGKGNLEIPTWLRRRIKLMAAITFLVILSLDLYLRVSTKSHTTLWPGASVPIPVHMARKVPLQRECGHWQKSYAKIHREIVSGQAPQRYVTWRCDPKYSKYQKETEWCGGLRDRTFGIINAFLYALLNDRAFIMDSKFPVPWEDLFDSPNGVEWQYTTERKAHLKTLNTTEVYYQIDDALIPFNKHEEIKDFQNIIMQGDRFVSWSWIRDSPQAKAMGLPAEGGFACMIDYLFTPSQALEANMQPYTKAMDERNSLSVGINIRYPDSFVIGPDMLDEGSLVDAQKIISCAFDVYKQWEPWTRPDDSRYTPRPLVIYLLTNSKNLRKEAMAAYPGVVVASQWEMMHIDSKNTTWDTAWPTVAENWIFSETRFKLIRENSRGFARLAAARAWWKYHHMIPWVKEDTDCFAGDLFSAEPYWWVEW